MEPEPRDRRLAKTGIGPEKRDFDASKRENQPPLAELSTATLAGYQIEWLTGIACRWLVRRYTLFALLSEIRLGKGMLNIKKYKPS